MIHWLQNTLEKHLKWLFIFLLAVIIVSFVFTIGAVRGIGEPHESVDGQHFYGYDLNNRDVILHLQKGAALSQELGLAPMLFGMRELEGLILSRAAFLKMADDMGIPNPDEDALRAFIQMDVPAFQNDKQQFDREAYKKFTDEASQNPDLGQSLVAQLLREEFRVQKVKKMLQISPSSSYEGIYQWNLSHTEWDLELVEVDLTKSPAVVEPSEEDLLKYYSANEKRYQLPIKRSLTYVAFKASAFEPKGAVNDEALRAWYEENPFALPLPEPKTPDETPEPLSFEEADKAQLTAAYKKEVGLKNALQSAEDFVNKVYEEDIPYGSDAFKALLSQYGLTLESIAPFAEKQLPFGTPFGRKDFTQAFVLDQKQYFSDVYETRDGCGVYFFDQEYPATVEPFEKVREKVLLDCKEELKEKAYATYAADMQKALQSKLAESMPLKGAAEALGLSWKEYNKLTLDGAPSDFPKIIASGLRDYPMGALSEPQVEANKAYIAYVKSQALPHLTDEDKAKIDSQSKMMQSFMGMLFNAQLIQEVIMQGFPKSP
jgi:hypothetical protein